MSRIHEALKKAEQERAASQGEQDRPDLERPDLDRPGLTQPAVQPDTAAPRETSTTTGGSSGGASGMAAKFPISTGMSALASSLSLETLLERSPKLQWQPDQKTMLFFNNDENARGTEEFRTLRSRLYHTRESRTLKKILVTSALPKEGKSFTSCNLAQVLVRQHGRRVLLIDADLRGPRLHLMLGTTASPGLSEYLQGASDEFSIMQRGAMENLFFIPSGKRITDPAELVANGRLKILMQRVEPLFDWVVIDSPPAVPVSDASVLAKECDGVLIVVRSNATPVDMARRAREEFPDEALIGVVLNGTDHTSIPYSRYYYEAYGKNGTESKS